MIILAIGMGLTLSLQFLLKELTDYRKLRRKAAETIRIRFQARKRHRDFLGSWLNRRDPTSIMGRSTAWDTDQSMVRGPAPFGAPIGTGPYFYRRRNYYSNHTFHEGNHLLTHE